MDERMARVAEEVPVIKASPERIEDPDISYSPQAKKKKKSKRPKIIDQLSSEEKDSILTQLQADLAQKSYLVDRIQAA